MSDMSEDDDYDVPTPNIVTPDVHEEPMLMEDVIMVENEAGGKCYQVCDILRLKRFLVLGSEDSNTYHSTDAHKDNPVGNIECLKRLITRGRHKAVLDILVEYAKGGRCVKDDVLLTALSICAEHKLPGVSEESFQEVRKATYKRVPEICNMPTKLFQFVKLSSHEIEERRNEERRNDTAPPAQYKRSQKKRGNASQSDLKDNHNSSRKKQVNDDGRKSAAWGRMRRRAVARFYEDPNKSARRLVYLMTKYKRRHSYSHSDLIKYAHPNTKLLNEEKKWALKYISHGIAGVRAKKELLANPIDMNVSRIIKDIEVFDEVRNLKANEEGKVRLLQILETYGKPRPDSIHIAWEHIPTDFLRFREVWKALLADMPMMAMIRNLGKMTKTGLFNEPEMEDKAISSYLLNEHKIQTAKVHPMKVLIAKVHYESGGKGGKGKLKWTKNNEISTALDTTYLKSFNSAQFYKTNKKYMVCVSVSEAMTTRRCVGCPSLTYAMAACAMALVTWQLEDHVEVMAFGGIGGAGHLTDLKKNGFYRSMPLNDAVNIAKNLGGGCEGEDCSLPIRHAREKGMDVDVFIIYTESQTNVLATNARTELQTYNEHRGRCNQAKVVVCQMASSAFTIADPMDPNMLDIVGFDMNVPELIRDFAQGDLSGCCGIECDECVARI